MSGPIESPLRRLWVALYSEHPICSISLHTRDSLDATRERLARRLRLKALGSDWHLEDRSQGYAIRLIAKERAFARWPGRTLDLRGELATDGDGCTLEAACFAPGQPRPHAARVWAMAALFVTGLVTAVRAWMSGLDLHLSATVLAPGVILSMLASQTIEHRRLIRGAGKLAKMVSTAFETTVRP